MHAHINKLVIGNPGVQLSVFLCITAIDLHTGSVLCIALFHFLYDGKKNVLLACIMLV